MHRCFVLLREGGDLYYLETITTSSIIHNNRLEQYSSITPPPPDYCVGHDQDKCTDIIIQCIYTVCNRQGGGGEEGGLARFTSLRK